MNHTLSVSKTTRTFSTNDTTRPLLEEQSSYPNQIRQGDCIYLDSCGLSQGLLEDKESFQSRTGVLDKASVCVSGVAATCGVLA